MITTDEVPERHLIPRWHTVSKSLDLGEFEAGVNASKYRQERSSLSFELLTKEFEEKKRRWQDSNDVVDAREFVGIAVVAGQEGSSSVLGAAMQVLSEDQSFAGTKDLAQSVVEGQRTISAFGSNVEKMRFESEISFRKKLLYFNPRDGFNLTELALLHANLGQLRKAGRYLEKALQVLPSNRYVLRANARFYAHIEEPDKAVGILRRVGVEHEDPWIMSALMASEALAGMPIQNWKKSKRLVSASGTQALGCSELASEIGTLELDAGSRRAAKKFFKTSLLAPTENSVAQIEWANRKAKIFDDEAVGVDYSRSHEAYSHELFYHKKIAESLQQCTLWADLEPFSSKPALFASFIACVFPQYSAKGLDLALLASGDNTPDAVLFNNLSVLSAYNGDLKQADQYLQSFKYKDVDLTASITATATEGLIKFRKGKFEDGSKLYLEAIEKSLQNKLPDYALRAMSFYARELKRIKSPSAMQLVELINATFKKAEEKRVRLPKDLEMMQQELNDKSIFIDSVNSNLSIDFSDIKINMDV